MNKVQQIIACIVELFTQSQAAHDEVMNRHAVLARKYRLAQIKQQLKAGVRSRKEKQASEKEAARKAKRAQLKAEQAAMEAAYDEDGVKAAAAKIRIAAAVGEILKSAAVEHRPMVFGHHTSTGTVTFEVLVEIVKSMGLDVQVSELVAAVVHMDSCVYSYTCRMNYDTLNGPKKDPIVDSNGDVSMTENHITVEMINSVVELYMSQISGDLFPYHQTTAFQEYQ